MTSASFKPGHKERHKLEVVHPYSLDLQTIQKCMQSLAYQERKISWSERKRVFKKTTIKKLSPLILNQFTRIGPDQYVVFKIANPSGKIFIQGDIFLTSDGMHWRFTDLNFSNRKIEDFSVMGDSWRLVPLKGQAYKTKEAHKGLVQDITNWIVFTKFRPAPSRRLEPPEPADEKQKDPPTKTLNIKKRLRMLDELKREGLIDPEEYQRKRLEILGEL